MRRAFDAAIRSFRAADAASNKDLDAGEFLRGLVGRLLTALGINGKQTYRPQRLTGAGDRRDGKIGSLPSIDDLVIQEILRHGDVAVRGARAPAAQHDTKELHQSAQCEGRGCDAPTGANI